MAYDFKNASGLHLTRRMLLGMFVLVSACTTVSGSAFAQSRFLKDRSPANRWSLDIRTGVGLPVLLGDSLGFAPGLPSLQAGIRYMLNPTWGLRPSYGYHVFFSRPAGADGSAAARHTLTMQQAGLEFVYSLSSQFTEYRIRDRRWNVLVHGGGFYTWAQSAGSSTDHDELVTTIVGGTLQYKPRWSHRLIVLADLSGHLHADQNRGFRGEVVDLSAIAPVDRLLDPNLVLVPSLGVQFYFGRHPRHVDWR